MRLNEERMTTPTTGPPLRSYSKRRKSLKIFYDQISFTTKRRLTCTVCSKRFTRQRTFSQTINPFNVNLDGSPKTSREIWESVKAEAGRWDPAPDCGGHS